MVGNKTEHGLRSEAHALLSADDAITVDHISVSAPGSVGMAGEQHQKLPAWLERPGVELCVSDIRQSQEQCC